MSIAESHPSASSSSASLRRAVGRWDLTALGINQVIGGAIFLIPASIAAEIGTWSPIGFEVAWMQWFVRVSSQAAIVTGIASALASYWPACGRALGERAGVSTITLLIGYWHVKGIRQSAWAINFFAVSKLIPLLVLIGGGLFLADWRSMEPLPAISLKQAITAGLLLVFAYGGFESVAVIAGEARLPRRDVPFALAATTLSVTFVMAAAQAVYVATARGDAKSAAPLAESARTLLGWTGAVVIGAGSVISVIGSNVGSSLAASRMLFAFAENGDMDRSTFREILRVLHRPSAWRAEAPTKSRSHDGGIFFGIFCVGAPGGIRQKLHDPFSGHRGLTE